MFPSIIFALCFLNFTFSSQRDSIKITFGLILRTFLSFDRGSFEVNLKIRKNLLQISNMFNIYIRCLRFKSKIKIRPDSNHKPKRLNVKIFTWWRFHQENFSESYRLSRPLEFSAQDCINKLHIKEASN